MRVISDNHLGALNTWAEARGEPYEGKVAVSEVVRNRMYYKYTSNGTVTDTILRAWQFSGWNTENTWRYQIFEIDSHDPDYQECLKAWNESAKTNLSAGAVLYYNPAAVSQTPSWAIPSDLVAIVG